MSRIGRLVRLFSKNQETVSRIVNTYIHHRNLYNKGENEVSFIRRLVSFQPLMLMWLFLRDLFPGLPTWIVIIAIPIVVILKTLINWYVGYMWDRKQFFDNENNWQNKRNPVMRIIEENLK